MIESEVLKDFKKLSSLIEAKDQKIADLETKLAEKEKELAWYMHFYQESIKDNKKLYENNLSVRHEICEKIRKEIKQLIESKDNSLTNWEYANGWCSALQYNMAEILQKIEKGEE